MGDYNRELIELTKRTFNKYYEDDLTDSDAREIIQSPRDYSKALLAVKSESDNNE